MADDKRPAPVVKLSPERWQALCRYFRVDDGADIFTDEPHDIEGVIYLPAVYRPA